MGHKVHPKSFRLQTIRGWDSSWFSEKDFPAMLRGDVKIRDFLKKQLKECAVSLVYIERQRNNITIEIHSAKPGYIIGRSGAGIEELKKKLMKTFFRGKRANLQLNVKEITQPSLSAEIVGQQIATDIEKRIAFRRSMKAAIERVMKVRAKGVKIMLSGRLNGAEIARTEQLSQGSIPLQNLRADIDYASVKAQTIYGSIGIKVWINRGEIFKEKKVAQE